MIMLVSGFINGLRKVMNGTDTEWQQRTELLLGEDKMLRCGFGRSRSVCCRNDLSCRCGTNDDCGCRHGAAKQYQPPVAGFAFHTGTAEGGSIGRAFQRYQSLFVTECVVGIFER